MRIYLCGRYSRRDELRAIREQLVADGHVVTSRWLDTEWNETEREGQVYSSAAPPAYRQQHAVADMEDVAACDLLIAFTEPPRSGGRGGRHVEFGAALALRKRLMVVGCRENLFCHHPRVEFYETLTGAMAALKAEG
jgi:hypothetical protein